VAGHLGFPKGKVHKGEHSLACALRVLKEETGLSPEQLRISPHSYEEYNEKGDCPVVYFHALLAQEELPPLVKAQWTDKNVLLTSLSPSQCKVLEGIMEV